MLGLRPPDLCRLRDVRPGRNPLPRSRGAQGGKKPLQIKPPKVRRAPGIALATGSAPVTKALIAINVAIYLICAEQGRRA